ncbi:MAG: hypothetical protein AB4352_01150 [Hormoscilla sp.]
MTRESNHLTLAISNPLSSDVDAETIGKMAGSPSAWRSCWLSKETSRGRLHNYGTIALTNLPIIMQRPSY